MGSVGRFHEVEKDGTFHLMYQSPTSSVEAVSDGRFLCPNTRKRKAGPCFATTQLNSSPWYVLSSTGAEKYDYFDHPVLPLFWCNNEEFDVNGGCSICQGCNFGTNYYFCEYCDEIFHKECVQTPPKIKHPYHPEHPLQLYFRLSSLNIDCLCCGRSASLMVYYCSICEVIMHTICAMNQIPFVIDPPKRHNHPLTLFLRQASLTCNVCGLLRNFYPTYICARCNFVSHNDCMYSPHTIKISRHRHRISYVSSLQSKYWSCRVCRQRMNGDHGAYACEKCSGYVVHLKCALGKDVWDGEDLEGVPEEDDITQDVGPFNMVSEGVILYFLHDHHLRLEACILYDESKFCQACALPIYEGYIYTCMKCDFILHETCANAPRIIQHGLHLHPLTLKAAYKYGYGSFECSACLRTCGGFVYECGKGCDFKLDVRCALISEPFDYKGHKHLLFQSLSQRLQLYCHVCKRVSHKQLNCIHCDFIVCFKCMTIPYNVRYKHDTHFLTVLCCEEVPEKYWCEVCERNLRDTNTKVFYWCKDCCTFFHIGCLLDEDPYLKPGQSLWIHGRSAQVLRKKNVSRPLCGYCGNHCRGKIFKTYNNISCSVDCTRRFYLCT